MMRNREVRTPGKALYFVAGSEDMIPAGTGLCKADKGPSEQYRLANERKYLRFDRQCDRAPNYSLLESEDMYYGMKSEADAARRLHEDCLMRTGRSLEGEETCYGPNWLAFELSNGFDGQQRARSHEPMRSRPQSPLRTGSHTARRLEHDLSGPPLRWPAHQHGTMGNRSQSARSVRSEAPSLRAAASVTDWGGLNGLAKWHSHTLSARTPRSMSPSRVKTPERRFRKDLMAKRQDDSSFDATRPRSAHDRTREKGTEFPRSPAKRLQTPEGRSPVQHYAAMVSPGVQVFSL